MTTPLWVLLGFAMWTIVMVLQIGFHRWKSFFAGTVPKGGFPSDVPPEHGWYRRAMQAHRNCVENLVVYGAIVVVLTVRGLDTPLLDNLALAVIAGRILQSLVHVFLEQTRQIVLVRFSFYFVQLASMIWMGVIAFQGV
ncbi:MAG: MAPEG family protein [Proteobacteria bacterium]|nr:MAPEG family protein [Pseudomonadota bacterium]